MFSFIVKHSEEYFDNDSKAIIVYTTYKLFNLITLYRTEIVTTNYEKINRFLPPQEEKEFKFIGFQDMVETNKKENKHGNKNNKKKSSKITPNK